MTGKAAQQELLAELLPCQIFSRLSIEFLPSASRAYWRPDETYTESTTLNNNMQITHAWNRLIAGINFVSDFSIATVRI